MDYLKFLNSAQLEAVTATEGYLRVIAGAGSGKTRVLVSRYVYLVQAYGIDPSSILCVTFTNKAAGEMRGRIKNILGDGYDTSLVCTYHGFCVRLLREDIEKIFYPKDFIIIDRTEQKAILAEIYQKHEMKLDSGSFEKILEVIGRIKEHREYVKNMCERGNVQILPSVDTQDEQIVEEYLQKQKQIFAMDFDDLMMFTLDILNRCDDVRKKWQERLCYIQVDEFQDSDRDELELINLLSAHHKNLMIVGDPDQNIYEWRGADVNILVSFDSYHEGTKTIFLTENYRSTPEILKCANTLIDKNTLRIKKDLTARRSSGVHVTHFHLKNEHREAEKISEYIRHLRKEKSCSYSDFALLYRSSYLTRIIEKRFTEDCIPYDIVGGVKFYERMEIQDIMAYLRLAVSNDDRAFKRIVNKPKRQFGRVKLMYLEEIAGERSLYNTLRANINDPKFKGSKADEFVSTIEELRVYSKNHSVSDSVAYACILSSYEQYIRELGDMERFNNLAEFKQLASEFEESYGESLTLREFVNYVALQSASDTEPKKECVKLMTVHASKGLEFPYVFIMGLSEGIFPSSKTLEERKEAGLEEERRLCYVAITRAKDRLILTDSEGFNQSGGQKYPSRFLFEMGEENYIRVGVIPKALREKSAVKEKEGEIFEECEHLPDGANVTHPAFGKGTVLSYDKIRKSYKVKFDSLEHPRDISSSFFRTADKSPSPFKPSENISKEELLQAIQAMKKR